MCRTDVPILCGSAEFCGCVGQRTTTHLRKSSVYVDYGGTRRAGSDGIGSCHAKTRGVIRVQVSAQDKEHHLIGNQYAYIFIYIAGYKNLLMQLYFGTPITRFRFTNI